MKSPIRFASLCLSAALTLSLGAGCGPQDDDFSLDTLPEASEDEKADSSVKYAWVRPSTFPIVCFRQPCATHQVREVNAGGTTKLIYAFDWRSMKLSAAQIADAEAGIGSLLVYGRYTTVQVKGEAMTVLQITRALAPTSAKSNDNVGSDRYYAVTASNAVCVADPCPTLSAQALGPAGGSADMWNKADLARLQLSATAEATLVSELKAGKANLAVTGISAQVAKVSQAFRPITAAPLK